MTIEIVNIDSVPLPGPTLSELQDALDELVTTLVRHRREAMETGGGEISIISSATLCATSSEVLAARGFAKNPVERALKQGIREVGELLYAEVKRVKSVEELQYIAEAVCDRVPSNWGRRMSPIDSAFGARGGIGAGNDRWFS